MQNLKYNYLIQMHGMHGIKYKVIYSQIMYVHSYIYNQIMYTCTLKPKKYVVDKMCCDYARIVDATERTSSILYKCVRPE